MNIGEILILPDFQLSDMSHFDRGHDSSHSMQAGDCLHET